MHRTGTGIAFLQHRKMRDFPFHEFIVVFTWSGATYRVDRGTDQESDTIKVVNEPSKLEKTSVCLIELHCRQLTPHSSSLYVTGSSKTTR